MNADNSYNQNIAIIGMAGRFPGANDIMQFWENLCNGKESITFFSDEELLEEGLDYEKLKNPEYVKARGVLENIEWFDAAFFGYSPREAELIDPQQRLFLECTWQALEDASIDVSTYTGSIGVYAGESFNTYFLSNLYSHPILQEPGRGFQAMIGNDKDFLATRISYKLNLRGPSVTVQTACSTSLVSVHMACQSLLNYECTVALAGGSSVMVPQKSGYVYQRDGIESPDGHCRAFDSTAQGTVSGSGVGVVILKRLSDAVADNDHIYAVIRSSAINNDGSHKVGYTAPSVDGQLATITEALTMANVPPDTITYIETHGTGTPIGDPIEIAALTRAFRGTTDRIGYCAIGSVKTNIGHLDVTSGVAGLIKTALMLKYQKLVPSLHFQTPNPDLALDSSPFYVNTMLSDWKTDGIPRRAGVSSFGIGGTNAHIILEEVNTSSISDTSSIQEEQLLLLSAKSDNALSQSIAQLSHYLRLHPDLNMSDLAYTLQIGRSSFPHKIFLLCNNTSDALSIIDSQDTKKKSFAVQENTDRPVAFLFPGQGTQYIHMAGSLYEREPLFRQCIDYCASFLLPHLGLDLRHILYPAEHETLFAAEQLRQTSITQPSLFIVEYALARLWMTWGIRPTSMLGHSLGEYVAACLAGVFTLEDALILVAKRGKLMQQLPKGDMLAVPLTEEALLPLLQDGLSLAAINGPSHCVISGPVEKVENLQSYFANQGILCTQLQTSHAFHSNMMDPILKEFAEQVHEVPLGKPQIPYLSNVSGTWITVAQATDPNYWVRHMRQTVYFAKGLDELLGEPEQIFLEVGPGRTLSTFLKLQRRFTSTHKVFAPLYNTQHSLSERTSLLSTLGHLWLSGKRLDWPNIWANRSRHRIPLPTYAFERLKHWVYPVKKRETYDTFQIPQQKMPAIADWFYIPSWKRSELCPAASQKHHNAEENFYWVVFIDDYQLGHQLIQRLKLEGQRVITVYMGNNFTIHESFSYSLRPGERDDYMLLMLCISNMGNLKLNILHLWNVTGQTFHQSIGLSLEMQERSFYSLLFLIQALGKQALIVTQYIYVISNNLHNLTGEATIQPEKALLLGPCRVIPQEYPGINCRSIDIVLPESGTRQETRLIDQLMVELNAEVADIAVAYRGDYRWIQTFERVQLEHNDICDLPLRHQGVYLITGGLGGIGLVIAEYLTKMVQARLVLVGRTGLPKRAMWNDWLTSHDRKDDISRKIRTLEALEVQGAEILVLQADVSDLKQMEATLSHAYTFFGNIHGVIHAAGVAGGGVIQEKLIEVTKEVLEPKVQGTHILNTIFQEADLDFFVLCSSLNSLIGVPGQIDYCAANAFLDAFANLQAAHKRTHVISINWDRWQNTGMAIIAETLHKYIQGEDLAPALLPLEGIEAFQRILSCPFPQIIASTHDFLTVEMRSRAVKKIQMQNKLAKVSSNISNQHNVQPEIQHHEPQNDIERKIVGIWQEVLGVDGVDMHDNFFERGGHSLLALQISAYVHDVFHIHYPLRSVIEHPTISQQVKEIQSILGQNTNETRNLKKAQLFHDVPTNMQRVTRSLLPLVTIQPHGQRPPLFCVHPISGSALQYADLGRSLAPNQPVYAFQARGRDEEEELITSIPTMAAYYVKALQNFQPEGPYLLAGWSFGAIAAFEMALQLQNRGQKVALLALFDQTIALEQPPLADDALLLSHWFDDRLPLAVDTLHQLSLEQQLAYVLEHAIQKKILPPSMSLEEAERLFQLYKANYLALQQYIPQRAFSGRTTLFWAVERVRANTPYPRSNWNIVATGRIKQYTVPGQHTTLLLNPYIQVTAKILMDCIEEALHNEK